MLAVLAACGGEEGEGRLPDSPSDGPATAAPFEPTSPNAAPPSPRPDGSAGTPPAAPCAGDDLCSDFEPGSVPPAAAKAADCAGTGALALDTTVAHRGKGSLRVDGKPGYCNHVFWSAGSDALSRFGDVVHVRFFVRFGSALGQDHVTFLASHDEGSGKNLRMGGQKEVLMWNRESDDATLPDLSPDGTAASHRPAAGTWLCVGVTLDRKAGSIVTTLDGASNDALSTGDARFEQQWNTKKGPLTVTDLRLGWESYGNASATLWFDDLAISRTPLGCSL